MWPATSPLMRPSARRREERLDGIRRAKGGTCFLHGGQHCGSTSVARRLRTAACGESRRRKHAEGGRRSKKRETDAIQAQLVATKEGLAVLAWPRGLSARGHLRRASEERVLPDVLVGVHVHLTTDHAGADAADGGAPNRAAVVRCRVAVGARDGRLEGVGALLSVPQVAQLAAEPGECAWQRLAAPPSSV